jgi:hypothetical protein
VLLIHGFEPTVLGVTALGHALNSHRRPTRYVSRTSRVLQPSAN